MILLKTATVLLLLMVSVLWGSALADSPVGASVVGARQGDWAMYSGAPPTEEYEWIHIRILQVKGSIVDLEMRYDLRARFRLQSSYYFPDHPSYVSINTSNGTSNFFLFLIPRNLAIGDNVSASTGHPPLRIESIEQRVCAGAERTVLCASFSNMTIDYANFTIAGRYYWDKETGLLVERIATLGNADVTAEILTGTSLWSPEIRYWIAENIPALVMFGSVIGAMVVSAIALVRLRKRGLHRVSHANFGVGLLAVGVILVAVAILYLTSYEQLISSLCFALAPFFLVSGVFAHTGAWVTLHKDRLVVDKGILMIAVALILSGIVIPCFTYRELVAIVPYMDEYNPAGTGGSIIGRAPLTYTSLEGVFFYPYVWLASAIMNAVICLAAAGFFYKLTQRF